MIILFLSREDKPSLSSPVFYSSQLSPTQRAFALSFLHESSKQHAPLSSPDL